MADRRQFLQAGLVLSATVAAGGPRLAGAGAAKIGVPPLRHFVFDNRYAEAVAMARSMQRIVPPAEMHGDLTYLWLQQLQPQWRQAPQALAGMTTAQGLFVLETLAADHRMRVVYRGEQGALQFARALAEYSAAMRPALKRAVAGHAGHAMRRDRPLVCWIIAPRATPA